MLNDTPNSDASALQSVTDLLLERLGAMADQELESVVRGTYRNTLAEQAREIFGAILTELRSMEEA